jgi:hypothetical protein
MNTPPSFLPLLINVYLLHLSEIAGNLANWDNYIIKYRKIPINAG